MQGQFQIAPIMVNAKRRNSRGRARPFVSLKLAPQSGFAGLGDGIGTQPEIDRETVRWVQNVLNQLYHTGLVEDGILGARTMAAVSNFQGLHGLIVWGVPDYDTRAWLSSELTELQASARYLAQEAINNASAARVTLITQQANDIYAQNAQEQGDEGPGILDGIYQALFGAGTQSAERDVSGQGALSIAGKVATVLGVSTGVAMMVLLGGGAAIAITLLKKK